MKTYTNILNHTPTDTAPMAAAIDRFSLMVVAMLDACQHKAAFEAARQSARAVRDFCRAEFANHQRKLKLDMLFHKHWRRLVLKELGGARALARWSAAMARCAARREVGSKAEPAPSAWRKTPERMAEELRQKAHAQKCAKAAAAQTPYIFRDPCKMDGEGQFRLPPLPKLTDPRNADAAWTTPFDIYAYNYDATPVRCVRGYNAPILVWPEEFETAEAWDYERWLRERSLCQTQTTPISLSSRIGVCSANTEPKADDGGSSVWVRSSPVDPPSAPLRGLRGMTGERAVPLLLEGHTLAQNTADERAT